MFGNLLAQQQRLARKRVYASIADLDARLLILLNKLYSLFEEFTRHPHGGDPRGIHAKHENERKADNARMTEIAFIVIAALVGGLFVWLSVETSIPPFVALLLIIAFMLVFSWAVTVALRRGVTWALDTQIREDKDETDRAEKRARLAFTFFFVGFVVALTCAILARNMVVGGPEFLGISQTLTEIFALLCAAVAGALHNFYMSIVSLVVEINNAFREVAALKAEKLALGGDIKQIDLLLEAMTNAQVTKLPPALPAG
jgi:hypothetical protein